MPLGDAKYLYTLLYPILPFHKVGFFLCVNNLHIYDMFSCASVDNLQCFFPYLYDEMSLGCVKKCSVSPPGQFPSIPCLLTNCTNIFKHILQIVYFSLHVGCRFSLKTWVPICGWLRCTHVALSFSASSHSMYYILHLESWYVARRPPYIYFSSAWPSCLLCSAGRLLLGSSYSSWLSPRCPASHFSALACVGLLVGGLLSSSLVLASVCSWVRFSPRPSCALLSHPRARHFGLLFSSLVVLSVCR